MTRCHKGNLTFDITEEGYPSNCSLGSSLKEFLSNSQLGKSDDTRSPRLVYSRFIFESITKLDDTIGIFVSKSFAAFFVYG